MLRIYTHSPGLETAEYWTDVPHAGPADITKRQWINASSHMVDTWHDRRKACKIQARTLLPIGAQITVVVAKRSWSTDNIMYYTQEATVAKHHKDGTINLTYERNEKTNTFRCHAEIELFSENRMIKLEEHGNRSREIQRFVISRKMPIATPTQAQLF